MQTVTAWGMRVFTKALPFVPLGMVAGNFFQGTGKAGLSMFQNACRQVIMLIPFLIVMPLFFDLQGVFMAQPMADVGAAITGLLLLRWHLKKRE